MQDVTAPEPEPMRLWRFKVSLETLLRLVIVGVLLDTLIAVVLVAITLVSLQASSRSSSASSSANIARIANYQTCVDGNEFRAENKTLWLAVVALIPSTTPKGAAFDSSVLSAVDKTFEPRVCPIP